MALLVSPINSFSILTPTTPRIRRDDSSSTRRYSVTSTTLLKGGILDDTEGGDGDGGVDFANFNPLKYRASGGGINKSSQQISLRQTTMAELTNKLLDTVVGDAVATRSILEEYQDFLLEPLEDQEAVLVSIYRYYSISGCCFMFAALLPCPL